MKKRYLKPTVAEHEIIAATNFMTSSTDIPIGGDQETGSTDAGNQRGQWGDLWSK